jgi:hypothetical protein
MIDRRCLWQSTLLNHSQHSNYTLNGKRVSASRSLRFSLSKCNPVLHVSMDQRQATGGVRESKFPLGTHQCILRQTPWTLTAKQMHRSDENHYPCFTNINKLNRLFATAPMQVLQPEHGRVLLSGTKVPLTDAIWYCGTDSGRTDYESSTRTTKVFELENRVMKHNVDCCLYRENLSVSILDALLSSGPKQLAVTLGQLDETRIRERYH